MKNRDPEYNFVAQATLDYHNRGILNSYEVEKLLNEFFDDCHFLGYSKVLVVTGKGSFVRPLVINLLKRNKSVRSYNYAGYFNGQNGAIEVELIF